MARQESSRSERAVSRYWSILAGANRRPSGKPGTSSIITGVTDHSGGGQVTAAISARKRTLQADAGVGEALGLASEKALYSAYTLSAEKDLHPWSEESVDVIVHREE